MTVRILLGDVMEQLKKLPRESVHCVVTSPPYWGLRDYGTAKWIGGDPKCDHRSDSMRKGRNENRPMLPGSSASNQPQLLRAAGVPCGKCGAVREDSQLGLEATPEEYIKVMVKVFKQVRRVLRSDGTLWLNMGDCYASSGGAGWQGKHGQRSSRTHTQRNLKAKSALPASRLKPKDLVGVPWMLAFALRKSGWWLRQDIIWAKPNPMPESVRDRCTKAHEYVFLLSKSEVYFYDAEAIAEPSVYADEARYDDGTNGLSSDQAHEGRNTRKFKRSGAFPSGWDGRAGSHRELEGRYTPKDEGRDEQGLKVGGRMGREPGWRERYPNSPTGVGWGRQDRLIPGGEDRGRDRVLPTSGNLERKPGSERGCVEGSGSNVNGSVPWSGLTRNKRDVWEIVSKPFPEAHFATFPPELPMLCIKAGTSEFGVCPKCAAPFERQEQVEFLPQPDVSEEKGVRGHEEQKPMDASNSQQGTPRGINARKTIGWAPPCECHGKWNSIELIEDPPPEEGEPKKEVVRWYVQNEDAPAAAPATVLDPFGGAGTTGLVADRLQRHAILIELNPEYHALALRRITGDAPMFVDVQAA